TISLMTPTRDHALSIWTAAVAAADPFALTRAAAASWVFPRRALVVGGGKAGAAMAAGVEAALGDQVTGFVNVPAGSTRPLKSISLIEARPAGSNHPTAAGVAGVERMLALVETARPGDIGLCLLSGGGSALLPAPSGVTLEDKQHVTKLLHASGAAIGEMNCVRKHLSRFKGGRLGEAFARRGCPVRTFILSDVVGDPLDVIASGPTAPDPTTCEDALDVLRRYGLLDAVPAVRRHLEACDETPKALPRGVHNEVIGNNARSLAAAAREASALGYTVLNLGSFIEGEARHVAAVLAGLVRSVRRDGVPAAAPLCILAGGETTVALPPDAGKGGRNQELALAALVRLRGEPVVFLSAGTDGEDGPTDAAGAVFDAATPAEGAEDALRRHDAYPFFDRAGGLVRTGLTGTNVMDVCVILIG
ncbi:MAG: glycerate kinase type-2 family protein, partial [Gemmataceae bacterium]